MALHLVRDRKPVELPETWEGTGERRILWSDWSGPHRIFMCPAPAEQEACEGCGEVTEEETSAGRILPLPGELVEVEETIESKRRPGSSWSRSVKRPASPYIRLIAFRCVECGFVEVLDGHPEYGTVA